MTRDSEILRTEEVCIQMDDVTQKDFIHRMSTDEFMRYKKNWWISLNTSGRNAPMKLRSDFSEAFTKLHRCHRESGEKRFAPILFWHRNGIRRLLHPAHHGGSGTIIGVAHQKFIKVKYLWVGEMSGITEQDDLLKLVPELLNEDDKLINTCQIIITQKLQVLKNDISATMVSWWQRVTSEDRYITIVSTLVTAVTYLGSEYRSTHDGDRRGFTVKPTAKYVDECLDIVQLQYAKAVMTPFTEQKSLNLHDETTACDQVQHSIQSSCRKTAVHYRSEIRFVVRDKILVRQNLRHQHLQTWHVPKVLRYFRGTRELNLYLTILALKPNDLNKTLKHITGYSDVRESDTALRPEEACMLNPCNVVAKWSHHSLIQ